MDKLAVALVSTIVLIGICFWVFNGPDGIGKGVEKGGENIKTINNESILGSGNIEIGGGSGGTSNYNALTNKPKINNVELKGNKSLNDLGIQPAGNYLTEETDPTVPNHVKNITQANITSWNNKLDSSKVKNANSTTAGDVYDVIYINNMIGDVETILTRLTTGSGV